MGVDAGNLTFAPTADINSLHLRDVGSLYSAEPEDVVTMYLTVREGNASDGTNHTWQEVNTYSAYYYDELGIDRYKVAALLQVGDENGPVEGLLGYGQTIPNATVQIRGQTSSRNAQKNYKIKLIDNSDSWNGQRTIALNKHMGEGLRFRNKLAYDLMTEIPQIMSLRTQFVHLYVRDLTGDNPDEFVDYGLYTQVEQLNKTALRTHGLDKTGICTRSTPVNFMSIMPCGWCPTRRMTRLPSAPSWKPRAEQTTQSSWKCSTPSMTTPSPTMNCWSGTSTGRTLPTGWLL